MWNFRAFCNVYNNDDTSKCWEFKVDVRYFYDNRIMQVFNKIWAFESTALLKPLKPGSWLPAFYAKPRSWLLAPSQLKLVSPIFYQIFIFHQMIAFKNYEKCFLFHLKSSFRSPDIQMFVFPSSPLFSPVSHYFGGWSKKNLKVYDNINCLNKKLITHFVRHLEKKIRCDIETLFIDRELNKEHFYENTMQKMCTKS